MKLKLHIGAHAREHLGECDLQLVVAAYEREPWTGPRELDLGLVRPCALVLREDVLRAGGRIEMRRRGDRAGETPIAVGVPPGVTTTLTAVVLPPNKIGQLPLLVTAYAGPAAPQEPWDPWLPDDRRAESEKFWAEHALVEGA